MHDPTLSIFEAIHSNEPKWVPGTLPGLEVRWEALRCETTVCSVCIWLDLFAFGTCPDYVRVKRKSKASAAF